MYFRRRANAWQLETGSFKVSFLFKNYNHIILFNILTKSSLQLLFCKFVPIILCMNETIAKR